MWNNINGYHFTIFFNIFVFMQVFNSINSRKLQKNEFNVFNGIFGNWLYLLIQAIMVVGQIILVNFGGRAVRTHPLSFKQHCKCIGIASLTLIWGFITKLLPYDVTDKFEEKEVLEDLRIEENIFKKTYINLDYKSRSRPNKHFEDEEEGKKLEKTVENKKKVVGLGHMERGKFKMSTGISSLHSDSGEKKEKLN